MGYCENGIPEELTDVETICWQLLHQGAATRKSAMHQCAVATAVDGMALMRTVVLRRVEIAIKQLYFHTDKRSRKISDFEKTNQISWLFYDQAVATQIRLSGSVILHQGDALAREHWGNTGHHSRRYYLSDALPSMPMQQSTTGLNPFLTAFDYSLEESEKGFEHFVVVESAITWMEWYFTHHTGNRRAVFNYREGILESSSWLSP